MANTIEFTTAQHTIGKSLDMSTDVELEASLSLASKELGSATKFGAALKYVIAEGIRRSVKTATDAGESGRGLQSALGDKHGFHGGTMSKAVQCVGWLHELTGDNPSAEANRVARWWSFERDGTSLPSFQKVSLNFASDDGEVRWNAICTTMGVIGASETFYNIGKGKIVHKNDPAGQPDEDGEGDEEAPEGDEEPTPADPAETFRLAIAQATAALGADEVRRIFMASQAV
jgi:hypothetical protein